MAEIIVTSTADSGSGSLRQAIAAAQDGDVILFDADVFPAGQTTSILLSSYIAVNKSVSIYGGFNDGAGGYTSGATKRYYVYREIEGVKTKVYISDDNPATDGETVLFENVCRVALDGQDAVRCARTSTGTIVLSGIAFTNGHDTTGNGGGVYSAGPGQTTLNDCAVSDCSAYSNGGGVYAPTSSQTTLNDCSITNCSALNGGGGVCLANSYQNTLNNCTFDGCSALNGGSIYSSSTSQNTLNNCTFDGCSATNVGGALHVRSGQNTLNNCIFDSCTGSNGAGAVYITGSSVNTFNACSFSFCSGVTGGAFYVISTSINTLTDCTITNCSASNGGGVYSASTSQNTLSGCAITNCSATTNGGGVCSTNTSQNNLTNCVISGCSATNNGGGVHSVNTSHNTLTDCSISGCSATNGGAAYSESSSVNTLINCTLNNNASTTLGRHGFVIGQTSILTATSCNIDAVYMGASSTLNIDGITLSNTITTKTATISIADGAALTLTGTASIGAATFTSDGRGYLAVGAGIDISSATLTGVVACSYGAGLESFSARETTRTEIKLDWTQTDDEIPVLVEQKVGDSWETVVESTAGTYNVTVEPATRHLFRAFDGVSFHVDAAWHGIEAPQFKVVGIIVEADAQDVNWQAITEVVNVDGAVRSGQSITILARIYDAYANETVLLNETGNIVSVVYTLEKRSKSLFDYTWTPVEGHDEVEVSSECVLEDLQTSDAWTVDEDGYSFVLTPDTTEHTLFATPGVYRFRVKITLTTGNPVVFYEEINVVDE